MTDHPAANATVSNRAIRLILELTGQQCVLVIHDQRGDMVHFFDQSGPLTLTVLLTEQGPVLRFEGAALKLQAAGDLIIDQGRRHRRSLRPWSCRPASRSPIASRILCFRRQAVR